MIGRQTLNAPSDAIASILGVIGISRELSSGISASRFAEPLFEALGAREVSSLDASDYEGASIVHDLNKPLPKALANRFSLVFDGGSLEHVFNIPQAFKNCMEMVCIEGHFIQVSPANNYTGHGFWQFCPELMYRIFSPKNGFDIKTILIHEHTMQTTAKGYPSASFGTWYKAGDPASHRNRIGLMNDKRTFVCTIARRVNYVSIFTRFPQQSDYVRAWDKAKNVSRAKTPPYEIGSTSSPQLSVRQLIPQPLKSLMRSARDAIKLKLGLFDRRYYRRISDDDITHGRL
jgi:hypothetical protein